MAETKNGLSSRSEWMVLNFFGQRQRNHLHKVCLIVLLAFTLRCYAAMIADLQSVMLNTSTITFANQFSEIFRRN